MPCTLGRSAHCGPTLWAKCCCLQSIGYFNDCFNKQSSSNWRSFNILIWQPTVQQLVHIYRSTQTVLLIFPFLRTNCTSQLRPREGHKKRWVDYWGASASSEEYYPYPTVFIAFIHLIKPGLTKQDKIELGRRSNWVVYVCARQLAVRRRIAYKIFINKQIQHIHK